MNKILALDIDGTLSYDKKTIPPNLIRYLTDLSFKGWKVLFLTGRTFALAEPILRECHFPYLLGVQNGVILLEMPAKKLIAATYITKSYLAIIENIIREFPLDFMIYEGVENGDIAYYRPHLLPKDICEHIRSVLATKPGIWKEVQEYNLQDIQYIAMLKVYGKPEALLPLKKKLNSLDLTVTMVRDSFSNKYHLLQITHKHASKLAALDIVSKNNDLIIAAGDDHNDMDMLKRATLSIAPESAEKAIQQVASLITGPLEEKGLYIALKTAIKRIDASNC